MDLISEPARGANLIAQSMALPSSLPAPTVQAAAVEVYWQEKDAETGALLGTPNPLGRFSPGAAGSFAHNPDSDKPVVLFAVSYNSSGVAHVQELRDAEQETVNVIRETDAPVIGQNAPATVDSVEIGITGFTRFARQRRVTISANADMSDPAAVLLFDSETYVARELPRYLTLSREAGLIEVEPSGLNLTAEDDTPLEAESSLSALPRTVYVTVAHSGGAAWTPESNVLEMTFAAGDGTGGSGGDFDPTPRDAHNLDTF
jgi:hypothetical protein